MRFPYWILNPEISILLFGNCAISVRLGVTLDTRHSATILLCGFVMEIAWHESMLMYSIVTLRHKWSELLNFHSGCKQKFSSFVLVTSQIKLFFSQTLATKRNGTKLSFSIFLSFLHNTYFRICIDNYYSLWNTLCLSSNPHDTLIISIIVEICKKKIF